MTLSKRRIDHLVLAVHDLEAAADFYRRIGFQVGARNRHPWGTENRLVQFGSAFLELITVGDADAISPHEPSRFSFGAYVHDYLEKREGLAMFVLDSPDAKADAVDFAARGIGVFEPFFFERTGRKPDGDETRVAFTLAFAVDPVLPNAAFFVCQQHYPENFWNPAFQVHPNDARGVQNVVLSAAKPEAHCAFLEAFTRVEGVKEGEALSFKLQNDSELRVERGNDAAGFTSFTVAVSNLAVVAEQLEKAVVPFQKSQGKLTIPAKDVFGVNLTFVEEHRAQ